MIEIKADLVEMEVDSTELQPGDLVIAVKKNWRHVRVHIKRLVRK